MQNQESAYVLCASCSRHIRTQTEVCPFCDASQVSQSVTPVRGRASVVLAMTAALGALSASTASEAIAENPANEPAVPQPGATAHPHRHPRFLAQAAPASGYGAAPMEELTGPTPAAVRVSISRFAVTGAPSASYEQLVRRLMQSLRACSTVSTTGVASAAPQALRMGVDVQFAPSAFTPRAVTVSNQLSTTRFWPAVRTCTENILRHWQWPTPTTRAAVSVRFQVAVSL
jgi:hypothetical protein